MLTMKSTNRKIKGTKLEYTFKSDVLFKMLFMKHPHLLKRLVAMLISIPLESISHFEVTNPKRRCSDGRSYTGIPWRYCHG
jgi:hypothetical protein